MTDTLRDLLRQDADSVEIPTLDPNDVIVQGEQRLRRRRRTALLAAVAAVAVIAVGSIVAGTGQRQSQGPVDRPDKDQQTVAPQTRPIVWANEFTTLTPANENDGSPHYQLDILHVGDHEVRIDQVLRSVQSWSMFVTDTGAVYAQDDGSVWLTDGGRPRKIAAQACVVSAGASYDLGLATGNAGPLVAWFDCAPASRGDLVVYDTGASREVARHRIPSCDATIEPSHLPSSRSACTPDALVGQHVYFKRLDRFDDESQAIDHEFRFDAASGQVERAGQGMYLDDLRAQPRTLLIGDTWQTGTPTEATGLQPGLYFRDPQLTPTISEPDEADDAPTQVFDPVTGQPVRFRLPSGYQPRPTDVGIYFTIFEWLDDDTVALVQGGGFSDIIVCHLSDGRCRLAVKDAGIVPGLPLPG
jgi:hypothetical protein